MARKRFTNFIAAVSLSWMLVPTGCGKTPTEVVTSFPTPLPTLIVDLAGEWTGGMRLAGRGESVTVAITQSADRVDAVWSTATHGTARFGGKFVPGRATPYLSGNITLGEGFCGSSVAGSVDVSHVVLAGRGFCFFDPVTLSLELRR